VGSRTALAAGLVLDAPCGTGRYFARVAAAGRRVVGIDQSAGMLARARARGIAADLQRRTLQELAVDGAFDAVMTIDAMENVPPEDWPPVLTNLRRALRPGGLLYLTVEEVADAVIDDAFAKLSARRLPAVRGEVVESGGQDMGYHYYPGRERVRGWLEEADLEIVDEDTEVHPSYGYWHLLVRPR
jgi:SAM-dependent methyltransferase